MPFKPQRILIVAENTSAQMGGEAILPLHYFTRLIDSGLDVWLVTHERVREELRVNLGNKFERVYFIRDTVFQKIVWRIGTWFPKRVANVTAGFLISASTGIRMRRLTRQVVREKKITVVHQPTPVSPKFPSHIYNVGVPTIIGPMNGGMNFPPAFKKTASSSEMIFVSLGRSLSGLANWLVPGKRRASLLLVANERTRRALPPGASSHVIELIENGVDCELWARRASSNDEAAPSEGVPVFCHLGYLKDMKAVDIIIEAAASVLKTRDIRLEIVGDGAERARLEAFAESLGVQDKIKFLGFVPQPQCPPIIRRARALLLPSLCECGGAVVLEAMSLGIPVVATRWGGPADYLNDECGVLVDPTSRADMVNAFVRAMHTLADDAELAQKLGAAGKERVLKFFTWNSKIETMRGYYDAVTAPG